MEQMELIDRLEEIVRADCEILMHDSLEDEVKKAVLKEATEIADRVIELRKIEVDERDKDERRRMDEKKSNESLELERSKNKLTVGKVLLEVAKLVVPTAVGAFFFSIHQRRAQQFEETGTARNQSSKDMHLPKYWK